MAKDITPVGVEPTEPKLSNSRVLFNLLKLLEQGGFMLGTHQFVAECYQAVAKAYEECPDVIEAKKKQAEEAKKADKEESNK